MSCLFFSSLEHRIVWRKNGGEKNRRRDLGEAMIIFRSGGKLLFEKLWLESRITFSRDTRPRMCSIVGTTGPRCRVTFFDKIVERSKTPFDILFFFFFFFATFSFNFVADDIEVCETLPTIVSSKKIINV